MVIEISIYVFIGFYAFYNTSKRAKLNSTKVDRWLQNHTLISAIIGFVSLVYSFGMLINYFGIAAGIFIGFIVLMTIGSLVIVLSPLISKNK
jgi:Mg/Co/Ni transporter MgtE